VTISDASSGVTIYYTTNGSTPTTSSTVYTGPITVSQTETVQAIAAQTGWTNSSVGSAAYTITTTAPATPTFSPGAGTYNTPQSVTISDTTAGAVIYYTTDGTTPTTSSPQYSGPISVAVSTTIKAIAVSNSVSSNVGTATYTLQAATPTFNPPAGTYSSSQSVTISDASSGVTIYYTTNGSTPTTSSTVYTGPITVSLTETVKAIAAQTGWTNSSVGSAAYTITTTAPATPTFSPGAGTYNTPQSVTISDTMTGALIYYTTDGTTPTTSSPQYSTPISVAVTTTIKAIAVTNSVKSTVGTATYTLQAATPTFNPPAGTYSSSQSVTISDASPGVTIYFTIDGSTPTTSSTVYTGPITVSQTETVQAIAARSGWTNSS